MTATARILVVADRTADSQELHIALVERQAQGPIAATLLAPAAWEVTDPHGGRESALRRLRAAAEQLSGAGIETRTVCGEADPFEAVKAIWNPQSFDEVIVSTLPEHLSRWLRIDLPRRVEQLTGLTVQHVVAHEREQAPASS
ncbi:MAG: hypothetical protein ACLP22_01570 [Solirubrobacteraceae bacterium]